MPRCRLLATVGYCLLGMAWSGAPAQEPRASAAGSAARDVVEMADGRRYEGLIQSESDAWLDLVEIQQPAGRATYVVVRPLPRSQVLRIERLAPAARDALRRQVAQWMHRARIEAARIDSVRLTAVTRDGMPGWEYAGQWFTLQSTLDEALTRRIVVRLQQVFTAYRQILPPRLVAARPPRAIVFGALEEYHRFLARHGMRLENPACYLRQENVLALGSNLGAYQAELSKIAAGHERIRRELEALETQLTSRLREFSRQLQESGRPKSEISRLLNTEKQKVRRQLGEKQKQLQLADRQNDQEFQRITGQMFTRLYHEAFHAYLENNVYPSAAYDVPFWLQEGLAVMMEAGVLEGDTLRIDAPHREMCERLHQDQAGEHPLPLADLLSADERAFVLAGENPSEESQRYYAAAWGLAYYLTFQQQLLTETRLDAYVQPAAKTLPPAARLEKLTGMPWATFAADWRTYILGLRERETPK